MMRFRTSLAAVLLAASTTFALAQMPPPPPGDAPPPPPGDDRPPPPGDKGPRGPHGGTDRWPMERAPKPGASFHVLMGEQALVVECGPEGIRTCIEASGPLLDLVRGHGPGAAGKPPMPTMTPGDMPPPAGDEPPPAAPGADAPPPAPGADAPPPAPAN